MSRSPSRWWAWSSPPLPPWSSRWSCWCDVVSGPSSSPDGFYDDASSEGRACWRAWPKGKTNRDCLTPRPSVKQCTYIVYHVAQSSMLLRNTCSCVLQIIHKYMVTSNWKTVVITMVFSNWKIIEVHSN